MDKKNLEDDEYEISVAENSDDDERTLIEQENLEAIDPENIKDELNDLANEADMPLEELLSKYGYDNAEYIAPTREDDSDSEEGSDLSVEDEIPLKIYDTRNKNRSKSKSPIRSEIKRKSDDTSINLSPKRSHSSDLIQENKPNLKQTDFYTSNNIMFDMNQFEKGLPIETKINNGTTSYTKYLLNSNVSANNGVVAENADSSSDEDYIPTDTWKKQIQVGKEHQADLSFLNQNWWISEPEHQADLLWDPNNLIESQVKFFLKEVNKFLLYANAFFSAQEENQFLPLSNTNKREDKFCKKLTQIDSQIPVISDTMNVNCDEKDISEIFPVPSNFKISPKISKALTLEENAYEFAKDDVIHDNPEALTLLMKSLYDVDKALFKVKNGQGLKSSTPEPWTEIDYNNFEEGLKSFGKDFFKIQQNKLPHKTVSDCVNFYYLWKKSERHDSFAEVFRAEKKRYSLHPGITDYMDKLVEDTTKNNAVVDSEIMQETLFTVQAYHLQGQPR